MRQYIGARYVPKFADPILHDSTRSYEAFEIVQNAVGDSFTSKKPVPVGIALNDTNYWVPSGNFNSQLALVSDRVDVLESTTMVGKTIAVFGDSWADPNNVYSAWIDELSTYSGNVVYNNSTSGRTSADILTAITSDAHVADIYIIQCGVNDWNSNMNPSTFRSNLSNIIDRCRTLNPVCDVILFTPPANLSQLPSYPSVHTYMPLELFRQAAWDAAENKNVMVCSGLKLNNFAVGVDGLHPAGSATEYIGRALIKCYEAGGDSRDFHNEKAKTKANLDEYILCTGGMAYAYISETAVFDNGVAHIDNDYINANYFNAFGAATNFTVLLGDSFVYTAGLDSTGITIQAFRASTGEQTVTGGLNVAFNLPIYCIGAGDYGSYKNNP